MADCDNIRASSEITHGLSCTTKIDADALRLLISRFDISKDQPDRGEGKEGRCEYRPGFGSQREGIEIWRANWTCAAKDHPFTYLEVRVAPGSDDACD
jgi:hypothetical protein